MNYTEFVARLANVAVYNPSDPDFLALVPQALEHAELRCYRDLDPIAARARLPQSVAPGGSSILLPAECVAVRAVWLLAGGAWRRLDRRGPEFLRLYSADGVAGVPRYWGTIDGLSVDLAPGWAAGGQAEIDYTRRLNGMSAAVPETWLGTWVPDLLFAAAMVFVAGFQKDFGAQAADGASWEAAYQAALMGAVVEERRRKSDGPWDNSRTPPVSAAAPPG